MFVRPNGRRLLDSVKLSLFLLNPIHHPGPCWERKSKTVSRVPALGLATREERHTGRGDTSPAPLRRVKTH